MEEVIKNGNKVLKRTVRETEQEYEPTTAEEKPDRRNEMKARGTLLMVLPNKDQLKFHSYKDAKLLLEAIEKRYGGNKESKKVQRTLLNQQYENFVGSSSETMDQTFDSTNSNSNSSTNEADNIAYRVSAAHTQSNPTTGDNLSDAVICTFLASQPNSPQMSREDLKQIDPDDLEEMDLQWEMAMLTIRAKRFIKRTGRQLDVNGQRVRFDRSKVECYNCHKYGHFTRECKAPRNLENRGKEINRRNVTLETPTENALVAQDEIGGQVIDKFKIGLGYDAASYTAASPAVESFVNSSKILENQEYNKSKSDKGYHAVPPPFTGNFIPRKPNLTFMDEIVKSENLDVTTVVTPSNDKTVESNHESANVKCNGDVVESKTVRKNKFRPPVIEDWNSDDKSEVEIIPKDKIVSFSTEKIKLVKPARETVEKVETSKQNKHYARGNQRNWNNLISQKLGILTRSGKINTVSASVNTGSVSVNTAVRSVNTASLKPTENHPRSISNGYKRGYSQVRSPFNKHMIGNKCYLTEYEDYDGGFVSFGDGKGRISGKVSECLVLSSDFKLLDESQVLLRVPRKDNIYSVDLKKGKQHKASCKTKLVNSISKPLHMLHMDLFGPTNVKSLMKKSYFLVVTDDFSRFSWVFFLATKDETSGILKTFITEIENQLDHKVKVIRCDNGTEFKNSVMNQLCEMKGIKREFSVARTPQQNGVAERRNRTLIEAERTMVLVIKPQNKTPYELIHGRTPLIDFMKPYGCPDTILNTRDHLGKFDGKADEGFFVGYSIVSKAMRVFNKRTRIVEETLNIIFLENTPNVTGNGPDWLFDVDSLTISMNYMPVVAGKQINGIAGTRDNIVTGQAKKKTKPKQEFILIPFCTTDPLISQGPKDSEEDSGMKPTEYTVSTARPSCTDDDPSSPVNAAEASNEFEEHLFERFSPFKNVFTLPPVSNVTPMDDTGIFDNAYDDEDMGAEADLNNLETTMNVSPILTTRIGKDHPKDQIIRDFNSAIQTRRMTKIYDEHAM
ncbi:putative ribonuclease H-like domain-containing protein, partial [Tanacetum coccineum]